MDLACVTLRWREMDSNFSYRDTRAPNSEASRASRVALAPDRAMLAAACTAVIAEAHRTAALCCLALCRHATTLVPPPTATVCSSPPDARAEGGCVGGRLPESYRMGPC